ncbi:cytochrome P450 family protein [Actinocorallia lasiicapitis]
MWEWLRENAPVYVYEGLGTPVWLVSRYADVHRVFSEARTFSNDAVHASAEFTASGLSFAPIGRNMGLVDPPDHTRLRKLAMPAFTPRKVEAWRAVVEEVVGGLIEGFKGRREIEFVADYAQEIPGSVVGQLLGIISADERAFVSHHVDNATNGDPVTTPASLTALVDYAQTLIEVKSREPGEDLVTDLIEARDSGDRLSADELVAMVAMFVVAAYTTTQNLLANAVLALIEHREQRDLLAAEPGPSPQAVEELFRYEGPLSAASWRYTTTDVVLGGVEIPAGAAVTPLVMSANRDPARFSSPTTLDLRRADTKHVSLGHGLHNCIGAALARLEASVALPEFVKAFPEARLAVDRADLRWQESFFIRGLRELPVVLA